MCAASLRHLSPPDLHGMRHAQLSHCNIPTVHLEPCAMCLQLRDLEKLLKVLERFKFLTNLNLSVRPAARAAGRGDAELRRLWA